MDALTIDDLVPTPARTTDTATSHAAARSVRIRAGEAQRVCVITHAGLHALENMGRK